jgi:O-antigen ligase
MHGTAPQRAPAVVRYGVSMVMFCWLAVELAMERTFGVTGGARQLAMLRAGLEAVLLGAALLIILAVVREAARGGGKLYRVPVAHGPFLFASLFAAVTALAACIGWYRYAAQGGYVLGDTFKFLSMPLLVLSACAGLRERKTQVALLIASLYVYGVFNLKNLVMYLTVLGLNERPVSIYMLPFMVLLWHSLYPHGRGLPAYRALGASLVIGFPAIAWLSQSLGLILEMALLSVFYLIINSRSRKRLLSLLLLVAVLSAALAAGMGLAGTGSHPGDIDGLYGHSGSKGLYLLKKLSVLSDVDSAMGGMVVLGGNRLIYVMTTAASFLSSPLDIFLGHGMGGSIRLMELPGLGVPYAEKWHEERHFIENGYSEVLYRAGLAGLLVYVLFYLSTYRRAMAARRRAGSAPEKRLLALCGAHVLYLLIFSIYNVGFPVEGIESVFLIALVSAVAWSPPSVIEDKTSWGYAK